ncbi:MAG: hypothetical protein D6731_01835 [Planctomycetota bacterium]|nr:MAG: hypothetical protein D6731_01835 [Planctomycetota bacterium]
MKKKRNANGREARRSSPARAAAASSARGRASPVAWLALALGFVGSGLGVACVARGGGAPAAVGGPQAADAPGAAGEEAHGEAAALRREVAALRERLDAQQRRIEALSEAFGQSFLVPGAYYQVTKVIDGDTFEVGKWRVRLLGVDTPESVHPSKPVEWYGVEASEHLKKLLTGKRVRLEPELGQALDTGAYDRTLAYVYLEDGTDVNLEVVRGGYGRSYHKYPCKRRAEFDAAEAEARAARRGLWNDAARLAWEDTHIIPVVPRSEARVIVAKSGIVHSVDCGAGPNEENGTYFRSLEQAAKFGFTKLHSCARKLQEAAGK